jgi:hypothetical protein
VYKDFETDKEFINLELKFDGEHIFASGQSGIYICILWLKNPNGEIISEKEYKTNEYIHTSFTHPEPPITLTEDLRDFGDDIDDNSLFDFLRVKIGVEVSEAGYYSVLAGLFKEMETKEDQPEPFYRLIEYRFKIIFLETGYQMFGLTFHGTSIWLSERNGPYHIGLWIEHSEPPRDEKEQLPPEERERQMERLKEQLIWPMSGNGDLSGERVYKTNEYRFTQFEEPEKIIKFTDQISDRPLDRNDNGLFEILLITLVVEVNEPGRYLFEGRFETKEDMVKIWSENLTQLRAGEHRVILRFKGPVIHKSKLDGIYGIVLTIKGESEEGFPIMEKLIYQTQKKYNHRDFESGKMDDSGKDITDDSKPYARFGPEGVTTVTDTIEIFTTRNRPEISFWYADLDDIETKFRLIFQRLIGYSDYNNNDLYDFGEEVFIANLEDYLWNVNDLIYSVNSEYGNYVEFELSSDLSLHKFDDREFMTRQFEPDRPKNYEPDYLPRWARLSFKFLITSKDLTFNKPSVFKISGSTELKIDINLEFYQQMDFDGICIEQVLLDESRTYGFKTKELSGEQIYQPELWSKKSEPTEPEMRLFEPRSDESKQWIMFIDDSEKEYGFYSWVNKINVTNYDGTSDIIDIASTYVLDGSAMKLYTNYPYYRGISVIQHDPSIGMVKESKPEPKQEMSPLAKILFNPLLYIGACSGALIFIYVLRKSQMKQRRRNQPPEAHSEHRKRHAGVKSTTGPQRKRFERDENKELKRY